MFDKNFIRGTMEITTVIGCKNNCSYCPQKLLINSYLKKSDKISFSLEDFKKCLSKIPKRIRIDFSGMAEPFLNPNCTEFILHSYSEGFAFCLFTTLIGLGKEDYSKIRDLPFEYFCIHLPDNDNKTKIVVDEKYLEVLDFIIKNPPKNFSLAYYGNIHNKIIPLIKKGGVVPMKMKIFDRGGNLEEGIKETRRKSGQIYCKGSKYLNHNILFPSGDVTLCCADYGMRHVLGNLLEKDYPSLFRDKEYLRIKKCMKRGGKGTLCYTCEGGVEIYSFLNLRLVTVDLLRNLKRKIIK